VKARAGHKSAQTPGASVYGNVTEDQGPVSLDPHPDRVALMGGSAEPKQTSTGPSEPREPRSFRRRPKQDPYGKEARAARKDKEEAERRQKQRDDDEAQRQRRIQERERHRKAVAKARQPGRNGRRKLGRESVVLLDKVRKMVSSRH
jgi:hypothetical protein